MLVQSKKEIQKDILPCCYFPTRVAVVSESPECQQKIAEKFTQDNREFLAFQQPQEAFGFLKPYRQQVSENQWLAQTVENTYKNYMNSFNPSEQYSIDPSQIRQIARDPLATQDISVLITDYNMPSLNGLEFLTKLSEKPFQRILLIDSGKDPEQITLGKEVLSKKLVQGVVDIAQENYQNTLSQLTRQCQENYFVALTRQSSELLSLENTLFSDEEMIQYFKRKFGESLCQEYYVVNLMGHYLWLDQHNQKKYFCVYTQDQLGHLADYCEGHGGDDEVSRQIREGNRIPFFGEDKNYQDVAVERWRDYLFSANKIELERSTYFTAVVEI